MIKKTIIFFSVLFLFSSCGDEFKTQYLQEVAQLQTTLDSLKTIAFNSDIQQDNEVLLTIDNLLKELENKQEQEMSDSILRSNLVSIKDGFSVNSGNLAKTKQGITEMEQSLAQLEHDIKHGINDRNKYQEFIDFEANKLKDIETVLDYFINSQNHLNNQFESLPKNGIEFEQNEGTIQ